MAECKYRSLLTAVWPYQTKNIDKNETNISKNIRKILRV